MNLEENFKITNSLKINSIADYGVCIGNLDELSALYAFIASSKTKYFILGEGIEVEKKDFAAEVAEQING